MRVHFVYPKAEYEIIKEEWFEAIKAIGEKGVFVGGLPVSKYEKAFAGFVGTDYAAGVANGTDALMLALKSLGIGAGDEVITVTNTFIATVEAIAHSGATPVLVDCEADSFLINQEQVKAAVTEKTKAIIVVHLYGRMVDCSGLAEWAAAKGIALIEDTAQAVCAKLGDKWAGTIGDAGCFSYYPDKNLGALGDAGIVVSNRKDLIDNILKFRNHGGDGKYKHSVVGHNSRLDPIQAAALDIKLRYLPDWTSKRIEIAGIYDRELASVAEVETPEPGEPGSHVYHLYVIRVPEGTRDKLSRHLLKKGVISAVQYPLPVHQTQAFAHLGYKDGDFPVAEGFSTRILSLPMHIDMSEEKAVYVADQIKDFFSQEG